MATKTEEKKTVGIVMEDRESLRVGIAYGDEQYAPQIADTTVRWSDDLQQEYVKDVHLKVNGYPLERLAGAAAIKLAFISKFGHEPKGIKWGDNLPSTKALVMQQKQYLLRDGSVWLEQDLHNPRKLLVEDLVNYLERFAPEIKLPRHILESHRRELVRNVIATGEIIGMPTYSIDVPVGAVEYPPSDIIKPGDITIIAWYDRGHAHGVSYDVARLIVRAKKQFKDLVDEFVRDVEEEIKHVYENRFLVIAADRSPSFIDVWSKINPDEIYLNQTMQLELEAHVFGPIRNAAQARKIDRKMLNRKIALVGEAGTGKTITTLMIAMEALKNGWTIVQITPGNDQEYKEAMKFVNMFSEKVIVIVEDLEKMMPDQEGLTTKQRLEARSQLLDMFDGGEAKGKEIMYLFTTNYPDLWISAMARPGRVDAYFEFEPLDRIAFESLVRLKLRGRLSDDIDFDAIWEQVGAMSSSFLAALGDHARLFLLGQPDDYKLSTQDVATALIGLSRQYRWYGHLQERESQVTEKSYKQHWREILDPIVEDAAVDVFRRAGYEVQEKV